ncbi:oxidoreductase [Mycobacteroides chelonae]|uniref:Short-chain dehydrogenase/reductase n=1 Tax=Mycobacteroides chelonae TaxID=1774 RepID=A0A1S1M7V4_MYCCH|nr:oxidoreductase [Mycobacteroides chelonae]OHU78827.1 short-chain dehydrogenase/reductase [Mycobacteroides chelonae]QQG85972.1 SDR family NAD(P)-dependent oxidoreductase [Mycobacteroides chelonae]QQG90789.1 SDR family NAD(P)-dependent oxidoreductase [Mycobacteroides chelonae]
MSVWFVTGASRGLGLAITKEALSRGHQVAATARDITAIAAAFPDADKALLTLPLDVTNQAQITAAVNAATNRFGRIDVLVNNAGRGLLSAVEEASDAEVRSIFDINVFGLLAVTKAALPVLRQQQSGHVINISSSAGFTSRPGWGIYASTKFAVEAVSEALSEEVKALGIKVSIIEPGGFRTDFQDASSIHVAHDTIIDYENGPVGAVRRNLVNTNHNQPGDPAKAARAIVDITENSEPPLRLVLGPEVVERFRNKIAAFSQNLADWENVSASTNFGEEER